MNVYCTVALSWSIYAVYIATTSFMQFRKLLKENETETARRRKTIVDAAYDEWQQLRSGHE